MELLSIIQTIILSTLLFGIFLCGCSIIIYNSTPSSQLKGQFSSLVCLWEDAPTEVLQGQSYPLANPLMTPLACLWEDAPTKVLQGQSYPLANPLMTPLACLWEDAPTKVLQGQSYPLANPLMTPLACVLSLQWHKFYQNNLAKPGINYWQWKSFPEATTFCKELSWLLQLPEPKNNAKKVLEKLPENRFFELELHQQVKIISEFKLWHNSICDQIDGQSLKAVYQVCYGIHWKTLQQQLNQLQSIQVWAKERSPLWWQILGVTSKASISEVESAYKNLIRQWHPDLNEHPNATKVTSKLNVAYQEYKQKYQASSAKNSAQDQKTTKWNKNSNLSLNLLLKWLASWLSSLLVS